MLERVRIPRRIAQGVPAYADIVSRDVVRVDGSEAAEVVETDVFLAVDEVWTTLAGAAPLHYWND